MPASKRQKLKHSSNKKHDSPSQQSQNKDADKEWAAREILAESSTEYLIDWEPNSDTGEKYSPTWEPKRNASKTLIENWKQDKAFRDSFNGALPSAASRSSAALQQDSFLGRDLTCSSPSSYSAKKRNRQKPQVRRRGPKAKSRNLSLNRKRKHICSSTEDSSSQNAETTGYFPNGSAVVDFTPHCSDSENIRGSYLVKVACPSVQPSAEVAVSEQGRTGFSLQFSGRDITLARQSIEADSTCFVQNSASSQTESGSEHYQNTFLSTEQANSCKSITLYRNPDSVASNNLNEGIEEIPESWEEKDPWELIVDPLSTEICAIKPLDEVPGGSDHTDLSQNQLPSTHGVSVFDEKYLSDEKVLSAFTGTDCVGDTNLSLNYSAIDQPTNESLIPSFFNKSQPINHVLSLQPLPTQSYRELDSSDIFNTASEEVVSSSTTSENVTTSSISLDKDESEELKSSIRNNDYTPISSHSEADTATINEESLGSPIATTLNLPEKSLTQNTYSQNDDIVSQSERRNSSHQTRLDFVCSQKESFESTFESLSALASSYVTPEPRKRSLSTNRSCEELSPISVKEDFGDHHIGSTSTSVKKVTKVPTSLTFGDQSDILILAPIIISEFQSSVPSSDLEDISTPFETQILFHENGLHEYEPALADSKIKGKASFWENYILKNFGIGTSDGSSHQQDRVLYLIELLSISGGIPNWKADAVVLLFIAVNPHVKERCSQKIASLAKELYDISRNVSGSILSKGKENLTAKPLSVKRDCFQRLRQRHYAPLGMEGENHNTSDNSALKRSEQEGRRNMARSEEIKDKEPLFTEPGISIQSPANGTGSYEVADVVAVTQLTEPCLGEEEYILPLPMQGSTAQQYRDIIPYYNTNIKRFTSKNRHHARIELRPVKRLLEHLHNITYHVDLENYRAFTQDNVSKSTQAKWDETCSSKFRVLGAMFDELRDKDIHIAVALRSGKPVTILENWLKSKKIPFIGVSQCGKPMAKHLFVSVITDQANSISDTVSGIDAIFVLDYSFTVNRKTIKDLQAKSNIPRRLAPVISFIVYASQEHILRCIPASLNEIEQLQVLASYILSWRLAAGKLPSEAREVIDCTSLVSGWLLAKTGKCRVQNLDLDAIAWPLPLVEKTDSEFTTENRNSASLPKNVHHVLKRPNDLNEESEYSKKMRFSPQFVSNHQNDVSITHISETNLASSQFNVNVEQQTSLNSKKSSRISKSADAEIILLKEQLQFAQEKVKDLESASEDIQKQYQKQCSEMEKFQAENKQLRLTCEREKTHNAELAEAVGDAFKQTKTLQEQEKQSDGQFTRPETPGTLGIKVQLKEVKEERDKFENKVRKQDKELDFIRERYREASDAAMKSAQQLTSLENALRDAQRHASGEAARLKQMHYSNYTCRLEDENRSLKAVNENLTDLLRRKDDELRTLRSRTILNARATSVPRSPRFGPGSSGSRAGSPPTPKFFHPLRTA